MWVWASGDTGEDGSGLGENAMVHPVPRFPVLGLGLAALTVLFTLGYPNETAGVWEEDTAELSSQCVTQIRNPDTLRDGTITVRIEAGAYALSRSDAGDEIRLDGFGRMRVPGKPALPSKIVAVAIPPGTQVTGFSCETTGDSLLPGEYQVVASPQPRAIGLEKPELYERDLRIYEENYNSVYGVDDLFPSRVAEIVRKSSYRKYNLVDVRVLPFSLRPVSGQLIHYPEITLHVDYRLAGTSKPEALLSEHLPRMEGTASEIVYNYKEAQSWYPERSKQIVTSLHDFVIITINELTEELQSLVDWETAKGRSVRVVTTTWISANYSGVDLQQKIRNFLRDKYPAGEWGIEDVLLAGHWTNIPMRLTWQDYGYGKPETDFYYAELSLPDDQSWDADGDGRFGESWVDPVDFYSEINVGRFPVSYGPTVESICNKSIAFEQNNDPSYKKNILLLGAYFWADTDTAVLMEYKTDPDRHPWMSSWTRTCMYEQNSDYWSTYPCDYPLNNTNALSAWSSNRYAFVNYAGHGSPQSSHILGLGMPHFIHAADNLYLSDQYPSIVFADACSNSDTDYANIGQALLKKGAVGFLGSNKVADGVPAWDEPNDGSTQSLDYYFTTYVTSGRYTQGEAHQKAMRTLYQYDLWSIVQYETFEWGSYFGNPGLRLANMAVQSGLGSYSPPNTQRGD